MLLCKRLLIFSSKLSCELKDAIVLKWMVSASSLSYRLIGDAGFLSGDLDRLSAPFVLVELNDAMNRLSRRKEFDQDAFSFYTSAAPQYARSIIPILVKLIEHIHQLLLEWPEHPTLLQVAMICNRILQFSVDSPLSKFLTGLELLLEKAQDWETYANRHNSIAVNLEVIGKTVIQWRKLELDSWQLLLDDEVEKMRKDNSVWWFHLARIILANNVSVEEKQKRNYSCRPSFPVIRTFSARPLIVFPSSCVPAALEISADASNCLIRLYCTCFTTRHRR